MSTKGQANFGAIDQFRDFPPVKLAGIRSDYTVIKWWAESMKEMSASLAEMRKYLAANLHVDPENKTFKSHRKKLAAKLKDVARKTKSQFGDPWGLVAMDQASGGRGSAKVLITGPGIAVFRERHA